MSKTIFQTSCFDNLTYLKYPVSISIQTWNLFDGPIYHPLMPEWFNEFMCRHQKDKYIDKYEEYYKKDVLGQLDPDKVVNDLISLFPDQPPAIQLVCYCVSDQFCHRRLVSDWLVDNGYSCIEVPIGTELYLDNNPPYYNPKWMTKSIKMIDNESEYPGVKIVKTLEELRSGLSI